MRRKIFLSGFLLLQLAICTISAITKKEAQTLVDGRRYAQAIGALQSLMQQSAYAKDADCNKWMGQSLCMTCRYAEALPYLEYAVKQNKKSGAQWYLAIARQHLYDFEGARESLETYRPVLKSDYWQSRADSLEAEISQGERAMDHIEDVVIVDSLLVPRQTFFSYYRLGSESGRILSNERNERFFENQAGDYRIYAEDDELYQCHKIQGVWEEQEKLPGLGSDDFSVIDPFMRSDGETLYFACDSTPGLGGFDIYKTKFNAEDGTYYQPERLGMPFNSPFDDYMLAIDETHQVGWWATDRRQDPDNVTIYIFKLEDDPEYLDDADVSRARIDNIADTWRDAGGYSDLVASLMNAEQRTVTKQQVRIVINDRKVYTQVQQFSSEPALAAYEQSVTLKERLNDAESRLKTLRKEYAAAGSGKREELKPQILQLEQQLLELDEQYRTQVKLYRSLEQ